MSITYCDYCDQHINLDWNEEHFDTDEDNDNLTFCVAEENDNKKDT